MCAQTYYDSDSDLNSEDYLVWEHTDNDEEITLNQSRKYKQIFNANASDSSKKYHE